MTGDGRDGIAAESRMAGRTLRGRRPGARGRADGKPGAPQCWGFRWQCEMRLIAGGSGS